MTRPLRTFVMGLGQMGRSHALAYHANPGFEIVGLNLTRHMNDGIRSLEVVLAADRSMRERRVIDL